MDKVDITVPDIGDFSEVDVIEVLVKAGDKINPEDPLVTLESDKASMDVPSTDRGEVVAVHVKAGDRVSEGTTVVTLKQEQSEEAASGDSPNRDDTEQNPSPIVEERAEMVVIGGGPGGYSAAFRASDLGKKTVLIERYSTLGGVCLNVGCIPSKTLLHAAKVINEAKEMNAFGVAFSTPDIDIDKLRKWKEKVTGQLTTGLAGLAKQRGVEVIKGEARFTSPHQLVVTTNEGDREIGFEQAIIATGSHSTKIPGFPHDDPRVIDSTDALALKTLPERLLVVGGGIIGLEMATVYHALGSEITVVELAESLIPGADPDIVKPLFRRISREYKNIYLGTEVTRINADEETLSAEFSGPKAPASAEFDCILVAVGRRPNGGQIGAELAGIEIDSHGFIAVNQQLQTPQSHIFAIGDVVGQPMLAHKATHEGKIAAEIASGLPNHFDATVIPSVAYTDPEIAWAGVTESEAKERGLDFGKGVFPWAASGRALSLGRNEGMTKILFASESGKIIGAGIVGPNAGELIAEAVLAIEMGADAEDIGLSIHPHPTLSETFALAAEAFSGVITDLYIPRRP